LRDDVVQGLVFESAFLGEADDVIKLFSGAAKRFARG
jgi:hypothetical protein